MKSHDKDSPSKCTIYKNMNTFRDWAMPQYLPISRFKLLKNVDMFNVNKVSKDLEELHDLHSNYPFASEKL